MNVTRLDTNPIIHPGLDERMGTNINGPSLIRVPDWLANPLGRYYLYFAHHSGDYIRMAYADDLSGPWTVHMPGVLDLADSYMRHHLASPDVHVDDARREIRMYYHGPLAPEDRPTGADLELDDAMFSSQRTRVALSGDGLSFKARPTVVAGAYLRVWQWDGWYYAVSMPGLLYRSKTGLDKFELGTFIFGDDIAEHTQRLNRGEGACRHLAVRLLADQAIVQVYYSRMGDQPEHIVMSTLPMTGDWKTWRASEPVSVLRPDMDYEGHDCPHVASKRGAIHERAWQLRDPAVFEEAGRTYLLYSVAGEYGIGMAQITD